MGVLVGAFAKSHRFRQKNGRWVSRFVFAPPGPPKPAEALKNYATNGSGTVRGTKDRDKEIQIAFWERAAREGFTDERARASAQKFRRELMRSTSGWRNIPT